MPMISMFQTWYPPAEPAVSFRSMILSILPGKDDFVDVLKEYLNVEHCVLGNSGKALLCRLLIALRKKAGYKRNMVLIPGYTCYSVAASVTRAGLEIACYDLDPLTLFPDMDSVYAMAGEHTLAIIGQHLFGIPTPMEGLISAAHGVGATLIEDAAQGFGGIMKDRKMGTIGDFGLFSFGRGKPLPLGGGGALVGTEKYIDIFISEPTTSGYLCLAKTAVSRLLSPNRVYGLLEALPLGLGQTVFDPDFVMAPMPLVLQRLGACSLQEMHSFNTHRNETAMIYQDILSAKQGASSIPPQGAVFTRYPFMAGTRPVPKNLYRFGVRRMYPKAILDEQTIASYCAAHNRLNPGAARIADMLITLPTHGGITQQVARMIAIGVKDAYSC